MGFLALVILLGVLLQLASSQTTVTPFRFVEVGPAVGIDPPNNDKVGPPTVGDLNQDGYLDIVQANHANAPVDVWYGSSRGTFRHTQSFVAPGDRHGTSIADVDGNGKPDLVLAIGRDTYPPNIRVELTNNRGTLVPTTSTQTGFKDVDFLFTTRLVDVDRDGDLDLIALAAYLYKPRLWVIYKNNGTGFFLRQSSPVLEAARIIPQPFSGIHNGFFVIDYNNDGYPDLFLLGQGILLLKGLPNFQFQDVTNSVLPSNYAGRDFSSGVVFDLDNDGDFDVYISGGYRYKDILSPGSDLLLENRNGIFVDISAGAGIPQSGGRQGIGAADFDNDGFMDIYLPSIGAGQQRIVDIILRNTGRKSFVQLTNHGVRGNLTGDITYPSGMQPLDYDRDGRVDVVVSTRFNFNTGRYFGNVQLFKNIVANSNNYLIVKVPVKIGTRSTLDAVLILRTSGGSFYRRVGTVGDGRTQSFVDQVHFGIGRNSNLVSLTLKLFGGQTIVKDLRQVSVNTIYTVT
uniref:ASPIC/UnbV domain-containing protein n=1 Tax=Compsopogon caeruleus TaxID=31354 RepID=A0A7S1TIE1_9RHOD|mmetsp:Transcript_9166/g.18596  ORF Transcript_9166/g.18596 Transcript_9166/m.18596 type:complete len:514 (+) Transcript_9166:19-1560(+)